MAQHGVNVGRNNAVTITVAEIAALAQYILHPVLNV